MSDAQQHSDVIVLVEILEVFDQEALGQYQAGARAQLPVFGGTVIGRTTDTYFGEPPFHPLMAQKWPSEAAFHAWQESDAYRPLRAIRDKAVKLRIAILSL